MSANIGSSHTRGQRDLPGHACRGKHGREAGQQTESYEEGQDGPGRTSNIGGAFARFLAGAHQKSTRFGAGMIGEKKKTAGLNHSQRQVTITGTGNSEQRDGETSLNPVGWPPTTICRGLGPRRRF